ncbi:MAG: ribonuclease Z [Lachnospiraceae bacterium]|nr:ribonuclease Z [Robinsoniella sp.]MDY3767965.1 ribonuclease Z [Lachnospiraceae bacterium]
MKIIVCLDELGGMMFNKRRQSQDRVVREKILELCGGEKLWMSPYSYKLYEEMEGENLCVEEEFLEMASQGEFCLVEDRLLKEYDEKIEELIVFWWNRRYPTDFRLDLDLNQWESVNMDEFEGSSHEKITKEIYRKKGNEHE